MYSPVTTYMPSDHYHKEQWIDESHILWISFKLDSDIAQSGYSFDLSTTNHSVSGYRLSRSPVMLSVHAADTRPHSYKGTSSGSVMALFIERQRTKSWTSPKNSHNQSRDPTVFTD
ncbi:hypothetical protein CBL_05912 [Carabus blaptoides fortunei]